MKASFTFFIMCSMYSYSLAQKFTYKEPKDIIVSLDQLRDQSKDHPQTIEILEAAEASNNKQVKQALHDYNEEIKRSVPLAKWLPALHGGNAEAGKDLFKQHCNNCHQNSDKANQNGPDLTGIFSQLSHFRKDLLTTLVLPSETIAPSYGKVSLDLPKGRFTGTFLGYEPTGIAVEYNNQPSLISHSDYSNLHFEKSTMPPVQDSLSLREIRDVMAYLTTLTGEMKQTRLVTTPFPVDNFTGNTTTEEIDVKDVQKRLYETNCAACHSSNGEGQQGFPPLAQSEWVSGDKGILIKILLQGLTGPIKVRGKIYDGVPMPSSRHLKDEEIAHILTYIRTNPNFSNDATEVFEEEIVETRATIADVSTPLNASNLRHPELPPLEEQNRVLPTKQDNESTSYLGYLTGFIILCLIPVVIGFIRNNKPTT